MKMRIIYFFILFIMINLISGCDEEEQTKQDMKLYIVMCEQDGYKKSDCLYKAYQLKKNARPSHRVTPLLYNSSRCGG